jgi:iron complex transport system substrate-binding protein
MRFWHPVVVVALLVGGCSGERYPVGGTFPEKIYTRIVSLSPSTTELLGMLTQEPNMIGRTAACNAPETIRDVPIVANVRPNIEKIVALQADIVVIDYQVANPQDVARLKELGVPVRVVTIRTVEDWIREVTELGDLFMVQTVASREVDKVRSEIITAKQDVLEPAPRVLVAMNASQPWVAGTESFQADVVRKSGGIPVGPSSDKFVPVSREQILQYNPDVVFVPDDVEPFLKDPAWQATNAGKKGNIVAIKGDILLRAGARVALLIRSMHEELVRAQGQRANKG